MKRHTKALIEVLTESLGGPPVRGAEVGVWQGDNSAGLLRAFPDLRLWMIDAWRADGWAEGFADNRLGKKSQDDFEAAMCKAAEDTAFAQRRRFLVREWSTDAAARFPAADFDFVFLDGDHTYAGVSADIAAWLPKVRPGGVLCGHDYKEKWGCGVVQAVNEAFAGRFQFRRYSMIWWVMV